MALSYTPPSMQISTRSATIDEACNSASPAVDPDFYVSTGSGQTATTVTGTFGSYYEFAGGTTANAETIVLLKKPLKIGARIEVHCDRSVATGVANNETFIELVEVDPALLQSSPATAVITSGTDAQVNNARNAYQIRWQAGTNLMQVWSRRAGNASFLNTGVGSITNTNLFASQGTSPNFIPGMGYHLKLGNAGITGVNYARSFLNTSPSPVNAVYSAPLNDRSAGYVGVDVSKTYALRIRIKNGATAPASSVITRLYRVVISSDNTLSVDALTSATTPYGSDTQSSSNPQPFSLPVTITQTNNSNQLNVNIASQAVALNVAALPSFSSTTIINTQTNLGASGVYTSAALSFAGATYAGLVRIFAVSDQASAVDGVEIQVSNSTATIWRTIAKGTLVADVPLIVSAPLAPYAAAANFFYNYRVRYTNGAVAQTNFSLVFCGGLIV